MKIRFSSLSRLLPQTVFALLAFAVAACNPVGKGIGPVRLAVNGPGGTVDAATGRAFQCFRSPLTAVLFFSDGSVGDFTSRVHWTSSNPAVVRVSNGDEPQPAPATGFFPQGVLTPVASGTVTITADYLGLTDTIDISVGTPTAITIHTVSSQSGLQSIPANNAFTIAPATTQALVATAMLDGVETNVTTNTAWSFVTPDITIATIDATSGLVTGVAAGGPLVAQASFQTCSLTANTNVTVANIQSISIQPEFGAANLFVGNSERVNVLADFGNGPEQDISLITALTSSDTTIAPFNSLAGLSNLLNAVTAGGPVTIAATYTQGTTVISAPAISLTTAADVLQSIAVTPATASVVAGSDAVVAFQAIGTYASGATQDVSRQAAWASSDTTIARVTSSIANPGLAVSAGRIPGAVTITAIAPTAATTTAAATAQFTTTAAPTP